MRSAIIRGDRTNIGSVGGGAPTRKSRLYAKTTPQRRGNCQSAGGLITGCSYDSRNGGISCRGGNASTTGQVMSTPWAALGGVERVPK